MLGTRKLHLLLKKPLASHQIKKCKPILGRYSMTENGDPLENAIAERVNGILKEEYLSCYEIATFKQARGLLEQVINLYNNERPHMSIGNLVPEKVHSKQLKKGDKKWKNYYRKSTT